MILCGQRWIRATESVSLVVKLLTTQKYFAKYKLKA